MFSDTKLIKEKIKTDTGKMYDIIFREKKINNHNLLIIYNEPLCSSDKISDFIMRSLNCFNEKKSNKEEFYIELKNNIANFKFVEPKSYDEMCLYLNSGFTIILLDEYDKCLALETKGNNGRSISMPDTESSLRGAKDAFVEDFQKNIALIKKRLKTNELRLDFKINGKYSNTSIGILSINGVVKEELVSVISEKIEKLNVDGIMCTNNLKNLLENESKSVFPTMLTTERPDIASDALLAGKVVIIVDNSPFAIIVPAILNDFFKTTEDIYGKSFNVTLTRVIKYIAFFISLLFPAIYIAIITYNHEIIPTELLVSFAMQRSGVPFPAFIEALMMLLAFEILKESDLRVPSFSGSSLSIVGALVLGEAAVNAGVVSSITIIVIAFTSICSLVFTEPELVNGLRWYRLIFMVGASFLGVIGLVAAFIYFIIELASVKSFGKPYLIPYAPTYISGLMDSILKFPTRMLTKRELYLSNNITKGVNKA